MRTQVTISNGEITRVSKNPAVSGKKDIFVPGTPPRIETKKEPEPTPPGVRALRLEFHNKYFMLFGEQSRIINNHRNFGSFNADAIKPSVEVETATAAAKRRVADAGHTPAPASKKGRF